MAKAKAEPSNRAESLRLRISEMVKGKTGYRVSSPGVRGFNPSGSVLLDAHIGQGRDRAGFPQGRLVELFGPNQSGKTGVAMEAGAAAQRAGGICVLITCEGLDDRYAVQVCGLNITDPDRWEMYEVYNIETGWAVLEAVVMEFAEVDYPVVVIVDSISGLGLATDDIHEKDTTESTSSAGPAKFLHQAFRRGMLHYLSGSTITLFMIRHQISGVRAGQGSGTTHGSSIDYHAWVRLRVYKSAMDKEEGEAVGHWRNIQCVKNKVGVSPWEIQQAFINGQGRNSNREVFNFLKLTKAIERRGAYYVINNESKYQKDWLALMDVDPGWRDWFMNYALEVVEAEFWH